MSESEFQELASAYIAGRISDADASRLREHIASNPALLEELAGQHDLHIMLHSMSRSQIQRKNLADRVIAAVSPDLNRRKLESAVIRDIKMSSASARKRRPS
jgi:anti-sigma factor RsiW